MLPDAVEIQVPVPVPVEVTGDPTMCRCLIGEMVARLNERPKSRPVSLAITKLEEAAMWLDEENRLS